MPTTLEACRRTFIVVLARIAADLKTKDEKSTQHTQQLIEYANVSVSSKDSVVLSGSVTDPMSSFTIVGNFDKNSILEMPIYRL